MIILVILSYVNVLGVIYLVWKNAILEDKMKYYKERYYENLNSIINSKK